MTDIPSRIVMNKPLASGATATKSTISTDPNSNVLNFDQCFPGVYSTPASNGGRYVQRGDMNAIANISTNDMFRYKCGGINEFDSAQCTAIGGYPKGAILDYVQGTTISKVVSLVANNTMNFVTDGIDNIHWAIMNQPEAPMLPGVRLAEVSNPMCIWDVGPQNNYAILSGKFTAGKSGAICIRIDGSNKYNWLNVASSVTATTSGFGVVMYDMTAHSTSDVPALPTVASMNDQSPVWSLAYTDGIRGVASGGTITYYGSVSTMNVVSGHQYAIAYFMCCSNMKNILQTASAESDVFGITGFTLYIA